MKTELIAIAIRFIMGGIALGIGIWYLSSSIGGASLSYTSVSGFLNAIGTSNGDIATANGCFLCGYVSELFGVIGRATEIFWDAVVGHLWILMSVGFGVFLIMHTIQHLFNASTKTATMDASDQKIEFKSWFDKVWRTGARVLICGALIGGNGRNSCIVQCCQCGNSTNVICWGTIINGGQWCQYCCNVWGVVECCWYGC